MRPTARRVTACLLMVVASLQATGCSRRRPADSLAATAVDLRPAVVTTAPVSRGRIAATVSVTGTLQAEERVELAALLPAKVVRVLVKEGATVGRGALLVQLDDAEIRSGIERAAAGVEVARANLRKAEAALAAAGEQNVARVRQAAGGSRAATEQARRAEAGVGLTREGRAAEVGLASGGVAAARAQVAGAEDAVSLARKQADADVNAARAALAAATAELERAKAGRDVVGRAVEAEIGRAEAGVATAQANLRRVQAGARPSEVEAARAQVAQARIARDQLQQEVTDLSFLHAQGGLAGSDLEAVRTQLKLAEQRLNAAQAQLAGATAGATAEEVATAQAQVAEAQAGLAAARAGRERLRVSDSEVAAAQANQDRLTAALADALAVRDDRVKLAEGQLAAARGELARAEAGLRGARAAEGEVEVRRAEAAAAAAQATVAAAAVDEARAGRHETSVRAADVAAARAGIREASAQHRHAVEQLARTRILAPVAGVVSELRVAAGDTALPGLPVAVLNTTAAAELVALCTPEQRARLRPGQAAEVAIEGHEAPFPGSVSEVAPVAEADGRTFKVRLTVAAEELAPGLNATAEIEVQSSSEALLVPVAAVQAGGEAPYLFVLNGDRAERRAVELGLVSPDRVEVISGLEEGELVIVEGAATLFDGARVEVRPAADSAAPGH